MKQLSLDDALLDHLVETACQLVEESGLDPVEVVLRLHLHQTIDMLYRPNVTPAHRKRFAALLIKRVFTEP